MDLLIKKNNLKCENVRISILANDRDLWVDNFVLKLIGKFKNINIVTGNIDKFNRLKTDIYEKEGTMIIVNNNKKKSLIKADIVVNIDFPEDILNKYIVNDKAIIINIEQDIKYCKKRFHGQIINNFEIKINPNSVLCDLYNNEYQKFDLQDLIMVRVINNINLIKDINVLI